MYMYTIVVHVLFTKLPQCVPYQDHVIFSATNKVLIFQEYIFIKCRILVHEQII